MDFNWRHRPLVIKHLEEVYGKDHVCHIGTWGEESIYTAIKDFARVLNYPPSVADKINKELQAIVNEDPSASFKLFDSLKENDKDGYNKFKKLEKEHEEIFRLARKFEGTIRQWGTHASGVIACPKSLIGLIPTRVDKKTGDTVSLFTGVELEEIGIIKYDILGLKNLTTIEDTLSTIGKDFEWLYDNIDLEDKNIYKFINEGKVDAVFQVESNMMKGLIKDIRPDSINDLIAINSLGRPGPLSANMHKDYASVKNGSKQIEYVIRNCEDILDPTYGVICFQEQLMTISKKIAGFNDGQADSITRKVLAKKRKELFPMMKRCHIFGKKNIEGPEGWEDDDNAPWYDPEEKYGAEIPGALSNGYTREEVLKYFDDIEGFAKYVFNKSHAAAYSYITVMTTWLKLYYPAQYMAAVLSMQTDDEKKEHYLKVCEDMGIKISTPDINKSKTNFTATSDSEIVFGLSSVKGVKEVSEIIRNAPYTSVTDAANRLPTNVFKKNVAVALIKSGAFDFEDTNRNKLLNEYISARNSKRMKSQQEDLVDTTFDRLTCMEYEAATLGMSITYKPAWKGALPGQPLSGNCTFSKIKHHTAKTSGKKMAMLTVTNETYNIEALVFPKTYALLKNQITEWSDDDKTVKQVHFVRGKIDREGKKLIIDSISEPKNASTETSSLPPEFFESPFSFM